MVNQGPEPLKNPTNTRIFGSGRVRVGLLKLRVFSIYFEDPRKKLEVVQGFGYPPRKTWTFKRPTRTRPDPKIRVLVGFFSGSGPRLTTLVDTYFSVWHFSSWYFFRNHLCRGSSARIWRLVHLVDILYQYFRPCLSITYFDFVPQKISTRNQFGNPAEIAHFSLIFDPFS